MPRLESFQIRVKTGERGPNRMPRYVINGFTLEFDEFSGGFGPGETFEATGTPDSFPHTLALCGPDEGEWDIEEVTITYFPFGEEPYTLRFGSLTLNSDGDLNIWRTRPQPVFDV